MDYKHETPQSGSWFQTEISNQVLHQKAPFGISGYKVINTQNTTYTVIVVPPTHFMPAADRTNCQSALRFLPLFVLATIEHVRTTFRKTLAD